MARRHCAKGNNLGIFFVLGVVLIFFYWDLFVFGLFIASALLICFAVHVRHKRLSLLDADLNTIDAMKGADFETYVASVLRQCGFKDVRVTRTSGDYGADILARDKSENLVIQCKRYNSPVGIKAVQEAHTAKSFYHCSKAIVITNSSFTQAAKRMAVSTNTDLWDRNKLIHLIRKATSKENKSPLLASKIQKC